MTPLCEAIINTGIDIINVIPAKPPQTLSALEEMIQAGIPAGLSYLARGLEARRTFEKLLPHTQSIICAGISLPPANEGWARFCAIGDYHQVMRQKLLAVETILREHGAIQGQTRICVDSAPILEREYAVRAGFGWLAHNRMLVHPKFGSSLVLAELLTTDDLSALAHKLHYNTIEFRPQNLVIGSHCHCTGSRACTAACPTQALTETRYAPERCLAYLTTQHTGPIDEPFAKSMGNMIWGCDRCQQACPAAQFKSGCHYDFLTRLSPELILSSSAKQLTRELAGTPMADAHPRILQRNACYVIGNMRDTTRLDLLKQTAAQNPCEWVKSAALRSIELICRTP